jgi:hypothetical protein
MSAQNASLRTLSVTARMGLPCADVGIRELSPDQSTRERDDAVLNSGLLDLVGSVRFPGVAQPVRKGSAVAKYLMLSTDNSQRWRLPDEVTIEHVQAVLSYAVGEKNGATVPVIVTDGFGRRAEARLIVNGAAVVAAAVVDVPDPDGGNGNGPIPL